MTSLFMSVSSAKALKLNLSDILSDLCHDSVNLLYSQDIFRRTYSPVYRSLIAEHIEEATIDKIDEIIWPKHYLFARR